MHAVIEPAASSPTDDDAVLLAHLTHNGPQTYGAAARDLQWGATRTLQAEARLLARGLVRYGLHGRAEALGETGPAG